MSPEWNVSTRALRSLLFAAIVLLLFAMFLLAALQFLMPPGFRNVMGANPEAVVHYKAILPIAVWPRISETAWLWWFRALLVVAWSAYVLVLVVALKLGAMTPRWPLVVVPAAVILLCLATPPSLSRDVYAYVGYGRMPIAYDMNPYRTSLAELASIGDDAARIAPVPVPTVYGPLWTAVGSAVASLPGSLLACVVRFKLVEAFALIGLAFIGAAICGTFEPDGRLATFLALGLNPLLLIEGPGNGHNDIFMAGLILAAVLLYRLARDRWAYLLLGLSVAMKLVSVALLPWFAFEQIRALVPRRRAPVLLLAATLTLAPTLLGLAATGGVKPALASIHRVYAGEAAGKSLRDSEPRAIGHTVVWPSTIILGLLLGAAVVAMLLLIRRMWDPESALLYGVLLMVAVAACLPIRLAPTPVVLLAVCAVYALLTHAMWRTGEAGAYLAGWSAFATLGIILAMPVLLPWYLVWPMSTTVTRWNAPHRGLTGAILAVCVVLTFAYAVPA